LLARADNRIELEKDNFEKSTNAVLPKHITCNGEPKLEWNREKGLGVRN
jgi:hypothetical protein